MHEISQFQGYTIDERLGEFRKVEETAEGYRMDTVTFESAEGQQLIAALVNAQASDETARPRR